MSKIPQNREVPRLDPVHDGRHKLPDRPLERESIPYVISLPEYGIGTFVYTWVTKDNLAGSVFVVYGPAIGDEPIVEAVDEVDVGPEMNFDDWQVGSFRLSQDLKLESATISGKGARVELEARFDALHPAYGYDSHPDGCPEFAATNRIEQAGRMVGTLKVDGKAYPFDTTAARDHSWGTRDWHRAQHWKWLHAQAGDSCVHFWKINVCGREELRGYVQRDGRMTEVESVDIHDFEVDNKNQQTSIDATVHDNAGRSTRVIGHYFGHFHLVPVPECTLVEGAMKCEIDGEEGVGWSEFMWPTHYFNYLQSLSD